MVNSLYDIIMKNPKNHQQSPIIKSKSPGLGLAQLRLKRRSGKRNRRYRRNDAKMLEIILRDREHVQVRKICRECRLNRLAFYRHYGNVPEALEHFEQTFIADVGGILGTHPAPASYADNKKLLWGFFFYIAKRDDDVFYYLLTNHFNQSLAEELVSLLYPKIYIEWGPVGTINPGLNSRPAQVYIDVVLVILREWAEKEHCDIHNADIYVSAIDHITKDIYRWKI